MTLYEGPHRLCRWESAGPEQTFQFGRRFALLTGPGEAIGLIGELGAGKTIFAKGFSQGLGLAPERVTSPTYAIVHSHRLPDGGMLHHVDCFRLRDLDDFNQLELFGAQNARSTRLLEWPDRFLPSLQSGLSCLITFAYSGDEKRIISVYSPTARAVDRTLHEALRRESWPSGTSVA